MRARKTIAARRRARVAAELVRIGTALDPMVGYWDWRRGLTSEGVAGGLAWAAGQILGRAEPGDALRGDMLGATTGALSAVLLGLKSFQREAAALSKTRMDREWGPEKKVLAAIECATFGLQSACEIRHKQTMDRLCRRGADATRRTF